MKLLLVLAVLGAGYYFALTKTTDMVLQQANQINTTYQYVANNADKIVAGQAGPAVAPKH